MTLETKLKIVEEHGDLLKAPKNGVMIHATNCLGSWGAGIALQIKKTCPEAYAVYNQHCQEAKSLDNLAGTCLLIRPAEPSNRQNQYGESEPWVACLFTSKGYGRKTAKKPGVSSKADILRYTRAALQNFLSQLREVEVSDELATLQLFSCRFNAGLFGVPWEDSKALISEVFGEDEREWTVMSP